MQAHTERSSGSALEHEASLPDAAGAVVLAVGAPRDRLVQAAHEPGQVTEAVAQDGETLGVVEQRRDGLLELLVVLRWEQAQPAAGDLLVGELEALLGSVVGGGVVVVGHHGVGVDVHGEDLGKFEQPVLDPAAAVGEVAAGDGVLAAQHGASNAARAEVVEAAVFAVDELGSWACHWRSFDREASGLYQRTPMAGVPIPLGFLTAATCPEQSDVGRGGAIPATTRATRWDTHPSSARWDPPEWVSHCP